MESAPPQIVPLRELAERFVRTYVDVYLKPGTAERYRHQLETIILPGLADEEKKIPPLGDRDYRTIKRVDVQELRGTMKGTPGAANNMVMVIASLYARIIEDWQLAPDMRNPAHGCRLFPMPKRERSLTPEVARGRAGGALVQDEEVRPAGQGAAERGEELLDRPAVRLALVAADPPDAGDAQLVERGGAAVEQVVAGLAEELLALGRLAEQVVVAGDAGDLAEQVHRVAGRGEARPALQVGGDEQPSSCGGRPSTRARRAAARASGCRRRASA